jgi:hypothetical protein
LEAAAANGEMPLDYMLRVMRDPTAEAGRRDEMAKAAAPYLHARIQPMPHTATYEDGDIVPVINTTIIIRERDHNDGRTVEPASWNPD